MKPGEVEVAKTGKLTITVALGVWAKQKKADGPITIRLSAGRKNFITTVNNKPGSKRYHKKLFGHLKKSLRDNGRWPFSD